MLFPPVSKPSSFKIDFETGIILRRGGLDTLAATPRYSTTEYDWKEYIK